MAQVEFEDPRTGLPVSNINAYTYGQKTKVAKLVERLGVPEQYVESVIVGIVCLLFLLTFFIIFKTFFSTKSNFPVPQNDISFFTSTSHVS